MSHLQQYTKIIKMLTLQTYFSEILSKLKRTQSQKTSNLTFLTASLHMTSCCLYAKVVLNISRNFKMFVFLDPVICKNTFYKQEPSYTVYLCSIICHLYEPPRLYCYIGILQAINYLYDLTKNFINEYFRNSK